MSWSRFLIVRLVKRRQHTPGIGLNTNDLFRPFRARAPFFILLPGATRFALAPGFHILRLRRCDAGEFEDVETKNKLTSVFDSFLGECIVRNYGGSWKQHDGVWFVAFDDKNVAFTFAKVAKQIDNGLEDGIASYFEVIPIVFKDLVRGSTMS